MSTVTGLDVVVVGGGIVGMCAAYYLQQNGMNVTVIERGTVGGVASGVACAHLELGLKFSDDSIELPGFGLSLLTSLVSDLGNQFQFEKTPVVTYCFNEREFKFLEDLVKVRAEQGWEMTLIDGAQAKLSYPSLPEGVFGAAVCQSAATVDIERFLKTLATTLRDRGGRLFENVDVLEVVELNGRVVGVNTSAGRFCADEVVVAAGAQTAALIDTTRLGVQIQPVNHLAWVTDSPAAGGSSILKGPESYAHLLPSVEPEELRRNPAPCGAGVTLDSTVHGSDGSVSLWGAQHDAQSDNQSLSNSTDSPQLSHHMDSLLLSATSTRLCFTIPTTPDSMPYIGRPKNVEGLIVAVGHSTNNAAAPAVGKLVAIIASGESSPLSISRFQLERHAPASQFEVSSTAS